MEIFDNGELESCIILKKIISIEFSRYDLVNGSI